MPRFEQLFAGLIFLVFSQFGLTCCLAQPQSSIPWPEFRGPTGMGTAPSAKDLPLEVGEEQNLKWKTAVPGTGWSSPVVSAEHVWMTTARPQGEKTEQRKPSGTEIGYESIDLYLLGFDRTNGEKIHDIPLFTIDKPAIIHSLNSYASPTPCLGQNADGQLIVYCHFGTFGTAAVNGETGDILWKNQQVHLDHQTGPGSSPILCQDRLVFHADGIDTQSIVALDTNTGEIAWRTVRSGKMQNQPDMKKAFCTPTRITIAGQQRLISTAADWMYLYDPTTGEEVLKVPYGKLGFSTVPRPVIDGQQVYFCTGFMRGRLLAVDLSPTSFDKPEDRIRWTYERQVPTMPSPLLFDNVLLMVSDSGIATCLDRESGEAIWTERLGGKYSASPLLADGKIYLGNQDGELLVLEPGDSFRLLATNTLDSDLMASPAAVGNTLYVRSAKSLYCFQRQP